MSSGRSPRNRRRRPADRISVDGMGRGTGTTCFGSLEARGPHDAAVVCRGERSVAELRLPIRRLLTAERFSCWRDLSLAVGCGAWIMSAATDLPCRLVAESLPPLCQVERSGGCLRSFCQAFGETSRHADGRRLDGRPLCRLDCGNWRGGNWRDGLSHAGHGRRRLLRGDRSEGRGLSRGRCGVGWLWLIETASLSVRQLDFAREHDRGRLRLDDLAGMIAEECRKRQFLLRPAQLVPGDPDVV